MSDFVVSRLATGNGLKLVGELDVATAGRLDDALRELRSHDELILDLSELTFLDSRGIHVLLEFARSLNGSGPLVILDPSVAVARVLQIVAIEQFSGIEVRRS